MPDVHRAPSHLTPPAHRFLPLARPSARGKNPSGPKVLCVALHTGPRPREGCHVRTVLRDKWRPSRSRGFLYAKLPLRGCRGTFPCLFDPASKNLCQRGPEISPPRPQTNPNYSTPHSIQLTRPRQKPNKSSPAIGLLTSAIASPVLQPRAELSRPTRPAKFGETVAGSGTTGNPLAPSSTASPGRREAAPTPASQARGEMRDRRIDRDDQIQIGDQRRRVRKVVNLLRVIDDRQSR